MSDQITPNSLYEASFNKEDLQESDWTYFVDQDGITTAIAEELFQLPEFIRKYIYKRDLKKNKIKRILNKVFSYLKDE